MELYGFIFAIAALVLVGIGVAIGLVACVAMTGLVSVGIISSSVLVGFWKRRSLAGIQAFLVQCGILMGTLAGAVTAWILHQWWPEISAGWIAIAGGGFGGALTGLLVAWMASAAAGMLVKHTSPWLTARISLPFRELS